MVLSRRLACEEIRMREKKARVHEARLLGKNIDIVDVIYIKQALLIN